MRLHHLPAVGRPDSGAAASTGVVSQQTTGQPTAVVPRTSTGARTGARVAVVGRPCAVAGSSFQSRAGHSLTHDSGERPSSRLGKGWRPMHVCRHLGPLHRTRVHRVSSPRAVRGGRRDHGRKRGVALPRAQRACGVAGLPAGPRIGRVGRVAWGGFKWNAINCLRRKLTGQLSIRAHPDSTPAHATVRSYGRCGAATTTGAL